MKVSKIKGNKIKATLLIAVFILTTLAIAINVSAVEEVDYSLTTNIDIEGSEYDLVLTVTDDGEWVTWTFDFPVEEFTGDGNLNVGLIIALDGEGNGPAYQIHNNDGATAEFPHGTWLMSPWGPTITDGWFGWHSGDTNTEVSTLDWVDASGNRNVPHGDGVLQIKIERAILGDEFHWAASPTVGSGFYDPVYDVTMQVPTDFGWDTPIVDMGVPNYVRAFAVTGSGSVDAPSADTTVTYTGAVDDTIIIEDLAEDEVEEATFKAVGEYVDVQLEEGTDITYLEIRVYYDDPTPEDSTPEDLWWEQQLIMYWYDGTEWLPCSDTGVETDPNYIWAIITEDTSPSLSQMTGTPFGPGDGMMLDKEFYHTDDTVTVTLGAAVENEDPDMKETVGVYAYSETHGYGVLIALKETGVDTGVFEGTFKLVDETPGTGEILVSTGDHFGVAYFAEPMEDEPTFSAGAIVDDTAPVVEITKIDGVLAADADFVTGAFDITVDIAEEFIFDIIVTGDTSIIVELPDESETTFEIPWNTEFEVLDVPFWPDETYTVTVTATDEAGNIGTDSITLTVDNTGPMVTDTTASPSIMGKGVECDVVLTATIVDAGIGVETVTVDCSDIGGASDVPMNAPEGSDVYTAELTAVTATVEGEFNLTITATDLLGNVNDLDFIPIEVINDIVGPYEVGFTEVEPISGGLIVRGLYMEDLLTGPGSYDVFVNGTALEDEEERLLETELISETWTSTEDYGWFKRSIVLDLTGTVDPVNITLIAYDLVGTASDEIILYEGLIPEGTWTPVNLYKGWNLVSLPLIPASSDSGDVLSLILDQGASGVVVSYGYVGDAWITNPAEMTDGYGYWLYMAEDDVMIVEGIETLPAPSSPQTYEYTEGWVLAGYKQIAEHGLDTYCNSFEADSYFTTVYVWDAVAAVWDTVSGAEELSPGQGFWLFLYSDQSLIAPLED